MSEDGTLALELIVAAPLSVFRSLIVLVSSLLDGQIPWERPMFYADFVTSHRNRQG